MDRDERRLRASLQARAADVEPTSDLYRAVQERIGRRRRHLALRWSLAGVAAVAAAVVVVPQLASPGDLPRPPEVLDAPEEPTIPQAPEPPEPAEPAPPVDDGIEPPDDAPADDGPFAEGLVVADDRTVSLAHLDGRPRELVTFPAEGESTVVDVAVRPGSSAQDLTVAITTRAEGTFDVRWLRVVDGEVVRDLDPEGTSFPAPPVAAAGAFPLGARDAQVGAEAAAAWSPDGDLLAALVPTADGARVHTIGWDDDGPSPDPNLAASFDVPTERPLELRGWSWSDHGDGGAGSDARDGRLLLVDELAGAGFSVRLDRQADGAPAMPNPNPLVPLADGGVLDLADGDGDGTVELVLREGEAGVPHLEADGSRRDLPAAVAGPRRVPRVVPDGDVVLVVVDPARPVLLHLDADRNEVVDNEVVDHAVLGSEVVAADAVR